MRDITPPNDELPVWQREALYAEKPAHTPYGYLTYNGKAVGARSISELKTLFKTETNSIGAVWVPERPRFVPVAEVPALLDELKPKRIDSSLEALKSVKGKLSLMLLVLGGICIMSFMQYGLRFYNAQLVGIGMIATLMFGLSPYYEAWKSHRSAKNLSPETLKEEALEIRFDLWMSKQKVFFTKALTIILIGLAVYQLTKNTAHADGFTNTSRMAGLLNISQLPKSEYWRIWTAPFLHGGVIHIFFNASALWYLGKRVEVLAKWPHFLMAFLMSAIIGSYCSIHFLPLNTPGIGASGGIMGLLGFLLTFELLHPKLAPKPARRRLIAAIVMMAVIGVAGVKFIDNAAHAGGLIAGAGYCLLAFGKSTSAHRPKVVGYDRFLGYASLILIAWSILLTYSKIS